MPLARSPEPVASEPGGAALAAGSPVPQEVPRRRSAWTWSRGFTLWLALMAGFLLLSVAAGFSVAFSPRSFVTAVAVGLPPLVALELVLHRWRFSRAHLRRTGTRYAASWSDVRGDLGSILAPGRVVGTLLTLAGIAAFMAAFVQWKGSIPRMATYTWDPALARADAVLHGGDPWRLSHRLFGGAALTRFIDAAYYGWYVVLWCYLVCVAWSRDGALRSRFLLTYLLMWTLLGVALAASFASGGPVYHAHFTGSERFAPLLEALRGVDLHAVRIQDALWASVQAGNGTETGGVAAMPSLHVAAAVLLALHATAVSRLAGAILWSYALLVQIGSVHLGWHYAIDGYVGGALTGVLWWGVGRLRLGDGAGSSPGARLPAVEAGR